MLHLVVSPNSSKMSNVYDLKLNGESKTGECLRAVEVPVICSPLLRPRVPSDVLSSLGTAIQLANSYSEGLDISIDILVGLDAYWRFVKPNEVRQVGSLVAQRSVFGWILSGSWTCVSGNQTQCMSPQLLCLEQVSEAVFRP
jgi:hypothetical protein